MTDPMIAAREPVQVTVKAGQSYWWCRCGRSKAQPFCDGSHAGTGIEPMEWVADTDRPVFFCQCKQTARAPFCDGRHNTLPE